MASDETLHVLLQTKFDRIENLVQMNHAATLAVPSVLAAIWGISLKEKGMNTIPILCVISIILLLIWRYFAHYLDDDVVNHYSRIIDLERKLQIPKYLSISNGIIKNISDDLERQKLKDLSLGSEIKKLCDEQSKEFIKILIGKKRAGYRGHYEFDKLALFGIYYFVCVFVSTMFSSTWFNIIGTINKFNGMFILFLLILFFSWVLYFLFDIIENQLLLIFNFTRNYDEKIIKDTYDTSKKYVPIISDDC